MVWPFTSSGPSRAERDAALAERHHQAQQLIRNNRRALSKPLQSGEWVETNQYIWYAYRGATAFSLAGLCLMIGDRLPIFRRYVSWMSLLGGYYLGGVFHRAHAAYFSKEAVTIIDHQVPELEKLNAKFAPIGISDYGGEVDYLKAMRQKLAPDMKVLEEELEKAQRSTDERVADLIAAYEQRKANEAAAAGRR